MVLIWIHVGLCCLWNPWERWWGGQSGRLPLWQEEGEKYRRVLGMAADLGQGLCWGEALWGPWRAAMGSHGPKDSRSYGPWTQREAAMVQERWCCA